MQIEWKFLAFLLKLIEEFFGILESYVTSTIKTKFIHFRKVNLSKEKSIVYPMVLNQTFLISQIKVNK